MMMTIMMMILMMIMMMMIMMMMMRIMTKMLPHVEVVGRALAPMVLVVVGFQLLIHVKGQPVKALAPNSRKVG